MVLLLLNLLSPENTFSFKKGTTANVSTYGFDEDSFKTNIWEYNTSPCYNVEKVELLDSSDFTYRITLDTKHYIKVGNSNSISFKTNTKLDSNVISIDNERSLRVRGQGNIDTTQVSHIQRKIQKGVSNTFSDISDFSTGVDNLYKDDSGDYIVASPSIPTYNAQPIEVDAGKITFSGTFSGTEFEITPGVEHGFYTGDAVYYAANTITTSTVINENGDTEDVVSRGTSLFDDGLYFVERVDGFTLKFAKSRDNLNSGKYLSVGGATVTNNTLEPYQCSRKTLKPQREKHN